MAEGFICGDVPYTCDGFDPADWPDGEVPDLSAFHAMWPPLETSPDWAGPIHWQDDDATA